jgi:hypothetical protein
VSGQIRITSDIMTGYPWCRRGDWGRRATVQLPGGTFRWGYLCPSTFEPAPGSAVVCWDGPEVVVDWVDGSGNVVIDELGKARLRRSDKGDGGWNLHSHVPDARCRVRTPGQVKADQAREAEAAATARRRAG